ncbi:response regulator [soil metagenome]
MFNIKPRVAVVENDPGILKALERLLIAYGYHAETYSAAELFLQRDAEVHLDCLLLDIMLDGMTGLDLQRILHDTGNAPPIIFITGQSDSSTIRQAREMGCVAFLAKPFEARALWEALNQALDSGVEKCV